MVTTAITVVVIERAIAVGFGEEQLWPFVSSGGASDDTGDLAVRLPLVLSQEQSYLNLNGEFGRRSHVGTTGNQLSWALFF